MKSPSRRVRFWLAGSALVLLAGALALWGAARWLLPSDAEVSQRIAEGFEKHYGIGLRIGGAHWSLLPMPVLVLTDVATDQPRPVTLHRIALRLQLAPLWKRVVAADSLEVEGAVLPGESIRAFRGRAPETVEKGRIALPAPWTLAETPLERLRWRDVRWIDRRDIELAYDGQIDFDPGWRPRHALAERAGASPPARLRLDREGRNDRWQTRIDVAGGSWNGVSRFETLDNGRLRVSAELAPRDVDIEALVQTFGRRTFVAGKLHGQTTLTAEADKAGALMRGLRTRTVFSVSPATLTKLDLAKAVSTAGISRGGRTALDELSGTLDTEATPDGTVLRYTNLKARSGVLTASGNVRLFNRRIQGDAAVDLIDGVVGVPLKIGGTLSDPELSLTGGALAGAAVGSAVLPGVGTAIGARVGQQVERLFGLDEPPGAKKKAKP